MVVIQVIFFFLAVEVLLLGGCIALESLSYSKLELTRGYRKFTKINQAIFSGLWYKPADGAKKHETQQQYHSQVRKPTAIEAAVRSDKVLNDIEINDRERTFTSYETAVIQFTTTAWNNLRELQVTLGKSGDELNLLYELSSAMGNGIWCRYFDENKGIKGHYINILFGPYIFNTAFSEDKDPNQSSSSTVFTKNKFTVITTKHARSRYANSEVIDFMDNGVFVKCAWKVFKPSSTGERKQEYISDFALKIVNEVLEKQNNYHLLLSRRMRTKTIRN